ncbi:MAG: hypothetical protein ICV64_00380 [Thermoleophilia bacterium]|nr:hypothetical protein [Thermoleophilia bacterium]
MVDRPGEPPREPRRLTDEELVVLDLTGEVYRRFAALPEYHLNDVGDVVRHIHAIQKIVSARVAYRTNPERFPVSRRPQ